jgi:hypothetical protein
MRISKATGIPTRPGLERISGTASGLGSVQALAQAARAGLTLRTPET